MPAQPPAALDITARLLRITCSIITLQHAIAIRHGPIRYLDRRAGVIRVVPMLNGEIFGLPIPDAGPVFAIALAIHIGCGLTAVIAGALAATAKKRRSRHPEPNASTCGHSAASSPPPPSGRHPLARRRPPLRHRRRRLRPRLYGCQARRRHQPGWPPHHAIGMGSSYIALLTGFYYDNGPFLPLWNRLPHWTYWLLPAVIGVPLIWRALHRYTRSTSHKPIRAPRCLAQQLREGLCPHQSQVNGPKILRKAGIGGAILRARDARQRHTNPERRWTRRPHN
jgi:hypothetical protein